MLQFYPAPESEELDVRNRVRQFLDHDVKPNVIADDEQSIFRREYFRTLALQKLTAITLPSEFGGAGLSSLCYYACLEELARTSVALSVGIGVTNLVQAALLKFGSVPQKEKWLKGLTSGILYGAFSLSESHSGSDAASLRLAAHKVDGGYSLSGTKLWCTNGGEADLYLVMARTGGDRVLGITSFLVPKETPGFRPGKLEKKLGLNASPTAELIFEDCFIANDQRLGEEGDGLPIALSQLDSGRIAIGCAAIGVTTDALERAFRFFRQEKKHGRTYDWEIQRLAEHYALLQGVKLQVREAARMRDDAKRLTVIAAQIKLVGSDLAMAATSDVVHFMSTAGVIKSNQVERLFRDAKALQIVEGTNQIQRLVLSRQMELMAEETVEI